jgi:hypothetical protein
MAHENFIDYCELIRKVPSVRFRAGNRLKDAESSSRANAQ